jgi:acyl-coenzyme A synthetase/AMP-(fatty) acid ligase
MSHASVAAAVVRGKKSAFSGALVEAHVVPAASQAGDAALRRDLLDLCRMHLPKHAVPALIRFVVSIEANSSGKQDRSS